MPRRPPTTSGVVPGRLAWALLAALPVIFLARGGKSLPLWSFTAAFLLLAALFWVHLPRVKDLVRHPVFPGLAGALLWYTLAWIFSDSPALGFMPVGKTLALAAFGAGIWIVWTRTHFRVFENVVLVLAAVQALSVGLGLFSGDAVWAPFPGNPHYGALWLAAGSLLCLQRFCDGRENQNAARWGWLLGAGLLAGALWSLHVRSVFAGYIAGLLVFSGLAAGRRVFFGVSLALVLGAAFLPAETWRRALKVDDPLSWRRGDIWTAATRGIFEKSALGWGPGHFEDLYRRHGLPQRDLPVRHELSTGFAHNDFLQSAADAGLPALLFWLAAIAGLIWSKAWGPAAPAAWGTLAVWGVTSLFNFPFALPVNGFLLAGAAASLTPARWLPLEPSGEKAQTAGLWLLRVCVAVFAAGFLAVTIGSMLHAVGGSRAPWDPRWREEKLERAESLVHPSGPSSPGGPEQAQALVQTALGYYPQWAEGWYFLGHLAADHRNPADGRAAYENYARAVALHPHHAPWRQEWAAFAERAGRWEDARELLREAIVLEPAYADAVLALARVSRLQGKARRGERILRRFLARRDPEGLPGPGSSPYRAVVLNWRPEEFSLELARCQTDQKLYREALSTLEAVAPSPERARVEAEARRGLRSR